MDLKSDFVKFLNEEMKRQKLSAYRLAKMTKVSHSTIQRILGGEMCPTLDVANNICIALGVKPNWFAKLL